MEARIRRKTSTPLGESGTWVVDPQGDDSPWHVDEFDDDGEYFRVKGGDDFTEAGFSGHPPQTN